MIIVLNDCSGKIQLWSEKLAPKSVYTYSHPNGLAQELIDRPEKFADVEMCIFDRKYHGEDLIYSDVIGEIILMIKAINNKCKLVVSSGLFPRKAAGFKYNIPSRPISYVKLNSLLENIDAS